MVKGCQREMVVLKCDSESIFESAYFILKKTHEKKAKKRDIIACANNIIRENCFSSRKKRRAKTILLCIGFFLLGAASVLPLFFIL